MSKKEIKFAKVMMVVGVLFFCYLLGECKGKQISNKVETTNDTIVVVKEITRADYKDNHIFYELLEMRGLKFPRVVTAQAILETGNMTSDLCFFHNNLFGMKFPTTRVTTASGIHEGYATFESVEDCITDYALWQLTYCKDIKTEEEYLNYLSRVYAADKDYKKKLKEIMKDI